ncbi:ABC transporter permease [Ekhidna sp.]
MHKINFKIACRSLWKKKGYTIINSLGLAIGLASCMLIALFVQHEYSYDEDFRDSSRIYRMVEQRISPESSEINGNVPYSFVGTMLHDFPEVEIATAIAGPFENQNVSIKYDSTVQANFLEDHVLIADSNFFKVFDFKMISGDGSSALKNPNSIVLSESTARRFFGKENALNQVIQIGRRSSVVTGVCEDPPANSHFKFSYIVSSTTVKWFSQEAFNLRYAMCYFKLKSNVSPVDLESKFPTMIDTYLAGEIERINNVSWDDFKAAGNGYNYFLRPLTSVHLDSEINDGMKAGGNQGVLNILMIVTLLIFTIASINFMNLSTVRSMERAREVGIKKVMGSQKNQLVFQFLSESFIISLIGVVLASMLTVGLIPFFNTLFDSAIHFEFSFSSITILVLVTVFVSLISGLYPAFAISAYKPVAALKGNATTRKGSFLKNGLVGFQFWISIILIICALVIQKQIQYLGNKDLGFDKDHLLVIEGTFHMDANYTRPFLEEARSIPGVKETAGTLWVQGQGTWSDEYTIENSPTVHSIRRVPIGDRVAEVLQFELIEGEFFSEQFDDRESVIINQAALEGFGIENPIGKKLNMLIHDEGSLNKSAFKIKGVIKNFNFQSLRNEVEPLVIQSNEVFNGRMSYILVKINGANIDQTISLLEKKWNESVPDRSFTYRFLDDILDLNYKSDKKLAAIFSIFSGLSIVIAIVGLLSLSAYTITLRTKEICIRKVVGASVSSILLLLTRDFVKIIILSFALACPIAWFLMDRWLQDFAYRINVPLEIFISAGIFTIVITWITISTLTIKAAQANPTNSLRME